MIRRVAAAQVPRELLLLADPNWVAVQTYLPTADCYAVWQAERVVGVVVVARLDHRSYEIKNLAIAPDYQHRGWARALLAFVIDDCRRVPNCDTLWIGTGNSSLRQLDIYQRAGFEMQTIWVNYFVDNYPEPIYEAGLACKSMVRLCIKTN
ncbi:GNAT family N-acetyltransferase [Lactiplantibacillus carotarum]|uniref:GNAT family N-acetyltransferase n=1 Tax=Lactiplantibacillus carotarum TaxID=2993456 RepID=UPI00298F0378|nr:GNAT family N-acetyltransferase [Lactiplantibacillus carotarum]